jgi:hypothetical protein
MTTALTTTNGGAAELSTMELGQVLAKSGYFQDALDAFALDELAAAGAHILARAA